MRARARALCASLCFCVLLCASVRFSVLDCAKFPLVLERTHQCVPSSSETSSASWSFAGRMSPVLFTKRFALAKLSAEDCMSCLSVMAVEILPTLKLLHPALLRMEQRNSVRFCGWSGQLTTQVHDQLMHFLHILANLVNLPTTSRLHSAVAIIIAARRSDL